MLARTKRLCRAIVYGLDPRPVELLTAQLSVWYAFSQLTSTSATAPQPDWFWALWCATAAACKIVGVVATLGTDTPPRWSPWLRGIGCLLGMFFWGVLAAVFAFLAPRGLTFGGFVVLALAQAWSLYRLTRRGA